MLKQKYFLTDFFILSAEKQPIKLSCGMLKQKYFLTDFFILSAEKQPIKLSWRNIEWLRHIFNTENKSIYNEIRTVLLRYKQTFITFATFLKMGNRHIKRKSVFRYYPVMKSGQFQRMRIIGKNAHANVIYLLYV